MLLILTSILICRFADKKVIIFEDIGDWGPKVPQDMAALLDVRTRKFTPIPTRTEFVTGLFRILSPLRRYDVSTIFKKKQKKLFIFSSIIDVPTFSHSPKNT